MLFINSIETVEEAFPVLADLFKHPEMYGVDWKGSHNNPMIISLGKQDIKEAVLHLGEVLIPRNIGIDTKIMFLSHKQVILQSKLSLMAAMLDF